VTTEFKAVATPYVKEKEKWPNHNFDVDFSPSNAYLNTAVRRRLRTASIGNELRANNARIQIQYLNGHDEARRLF
jgi:hypothetical protein